MLTASQHAASAAAADGGRAAAAAAAVALTGRRLAANRAPRRHAREQRGGGLVLSTGGLVKLQGEGTTADGHARRERGILGARRRRSGLITLHGQGHSAGRGQEDNAAHTKTAGEQRVREAAAKHAALCAEACRKKDAWPCVRAPDEATLCAAVSHARAHGQARDTGPQEEAARAPR